MISVLIDTHIQVDNVSILEWSRVRDAVADDLIDGSAETPGIVVIVQWRGVRIVLYYELMHHSIDLLSGHARRHRLVGQIQCLSSQLAGKPDLLNLLLSVDGCDLIILALEGVVGLASGGVVRLLN